MSPKSLLLTAGLLLSGSTLANGLNIASGTYTLDKTHGYITFSYSHQGYSNPWLRFRDFDVTLELDTENLAASTAEVSVNTASIDTGVDEFDQHMVGERFFNVEAFPKASFTTTSVEMTGERSMDLTGDLTIKGVTKPVTLAVKLNKTGQHFRSRKDMLGFSGTTSLKRSDFDLGYAVPMVGDEVAITVEVELIKAD